MSDTADKYEALRQAIAAGPTPGPWRVSAGVVDNARLIVEDDIGLAVCAMSLRGVHGDRRKMEANADLIAAADPDTIAALLAENKLLHDALESVIDEYEAGESTAGDPEKAFRVAYCAALAALNRVTFARTTGEQA